MKYLDKYGWPVTIFKGRPITNLIRRLIHTRKIVKHWESPEYAKPGYKDPQTEALLEEGE